MIIILLGVIRERLSHYYRNKTPCPDLSAGIARKVIEQYIRTYKYKAPIQRAHVHICEGLSLEITHMTAEMNLDARVLTGSYRELMKILLSKDQHSTSTFDSNAKGHLLCAICRRM